MGQMYPFERFTERAKRILVLAQEEAERSHHSYIGTEHLLLGLLREKEGLAAKVLANLGVEIGAVRETIESVLGRNQRIAVDQIIPTSRVKKVIEIAFEESRRMGHNYVSTEHLLMGLLIEGEGIAAHVLEDLGATLAKVRGEIERLATDVSLVEVPTPRASPTPVLDLCGRDLTDLVRRNQLDFLSGRGGQITRVIEILSQQSRNSAIVIGDPAIRQGVLAGLAGRVFSELVPSVLTNRRLKTIDPTAIVRNARERGDFQRRLERSLFEIVEEARVVKGVLIIVDNIDMFLGGVDEWAGASTTAFTGPIKTGQIQCIGCTSAEGFERYIRSDHDFERNFETVRLGDPNLDEVIEILSQRRSDLERHHLVAISDETLARAAELSNNKPTLAEALLDRAASHVRRRAGELPDDLKNLQGEIRNLRLRQDNLVIEQDFEAAANTRDDVRKLMDELIRRETEWRDALGEQRPSVTPDDVISAAVDEDTNENRTGQNPR